MTAAVERNPRTEQLRIDRVLIAAAVAALFGESARVRRVRAIPGREQGEWLREGRLSIQSSHSRGAPLARMARNLGTRDV